MSRGDYVWGVEDGGYIVGFRRENEGNGRRDLLGKGERKFF